MSKLSSIQNANTMSKYFLFQKYLFPSWSCRNILEGELINVPILMVNIVEVGGVKLFNSIVKYVNQTRSSSLFFFFPIFMSV